MSDLNDKLLEIKRQKDEYILPENLKKDVIVYGVTGTLEPGSGGVKLFDTVEHMQQDPSPSEGDLAVVYREEIQPINEESEFDSCIFPNTVVLDTAFSDEIYGSFMSTGSSYFEGNVDMSSSNFRFDGFGDGMKRVRYTSSDGITYTRTDGGEELQEFGTAIKWESGSSFNSVIGNFMKIGGNYFDGLYEYNLNVINKNYIWLRDLQDISFDNSNVIFQDMYFYKFSYSYFLNLIDKLDQLGRTSLGSMHIYRGVDGEMYAFLPKGLYVNYVYTTPNGTLVFNREQFAPLNMNYYKYNSNTYTFDLIREGITDTDLTAIPNSSYTFYDSNNLFVKPSSTIWKAQSKPPMKDMVGSPDRFISNDFSIFTGSIYNKSFIYGLENKYLIAKSQLDATYDYVYNKTFFGKDGVENGTLSTNVSNSFADVNAEVYAKLQQQYDNMQPRVLTDQDKSIDGNIRTIPCKSDGTPLLDTSNVTNMENMFANHKGLVCIPLIDTSSVTNMSFMLAGCPLLVTLPQLDTSNVTNMGSMFSSCLDLRELPQFNTINVTSMSCMLAGCSNLITVPQLNTSNVTDMSYMFDYCSNLSNESLNNILAMCTNATKMSSNKTLKKIGITQAQAQICTTLSNYQAFVNAGWTTGY